MTNATRRKLLVWGTLLVMVAGLLIAGVVWLNNAQARSKRLQAYGRLCQMQLALRMYEDDYGTLPPLSLRDTAGTPTQSWRALILPYLGFGISTQLNLSQPWSSDYNRRLIDSIPPGDWVWFALNRAEIKSPVSTRILAYLGRESMWDVITGMPKGKTAEYPGVVLLVWIPKGNLHPLQPGDITEEEVRERVMKGEEVLFIAAGDGYRYGIITLERGELAFHTWQEELDRREARR